MARTLLDVAQKVARRCRLNPSFTAFSDDDETQMLVDFINEAVSELRNKLPWVPTAEGRGTLSLVAGTRLYDVASDALATEIYLWSLANQTDDNVAIEAGTLEWVKKNDTDYLTVQGKPTTLYVENGQLGFYPVPDGNYTITYIYPEIPAVMSTTTATFPYPDDWLLWVELAATITYKDLKGMDYELDFKKQEDHYAYIYAEICKAQPQVVI